MNVLRDLSPHRAWLGPSRFSPAQRSTPGFPACASGACAIESASKLDKFSVHSSCHEFAVAGSLYHPDEARTNPIDFAGPLTPASPKGASPAALNNSARSDVIVFHLFDQR